MLVPIIHLCSYIHNIAPSRLQWVAKNLEIGAALYSICGAVVWVLEQLRERGQRSRVTNMQLYLGQTLLQRVW